jgi:hypothetical protein
MLFAMLFQVEKYEIILIEGQVIEVFFDTIGS